MAKCLVTQRSLDKAALSAAFNFSQRQLLDNYGSRSLVLRLFSERCYGKCISEKLSRFLKRATPPCVASMCARTKIPIQPVETVAAPSARLLKFYVWEFEAMRPVFRKWLRLNATGSPALDDMLPVDTAEHLSDVWLIDALKKHHARTYDPQEASLHVLALPA